MKIDDVRYIFSLGAGTMGQQIALQCAMHGYDVIVYDLSSDVLRDAAAARSPEAVAAADKFKDEYIDKGLLGVKAGKGFYTYPNPAYERPGFLTGKA